MGRILHHRGAIWFCCLKYYTKMNSVILLPLIAAHFDTSLSLFLSLCLCILFCGFVPATSHRALSVPRFSPCQRQHLNKLTCYISLFWPLASVDTHTHIRRRLYTLISSWCIVCALTDEISLLCGSAICGFRYWFRPYILLFLSLFPRMVTSHPTLSGCTSQMLHSQAILMYFQPNPFAHCAANDYSIHVNLRPSHMVSLTFFVCVLPGFFI